MGKTKVVVSCPLSTYSGYGGRARDFVESLLKIEDLDIEVLDQRWGNTRRTFLKDHNLKHLQDLITTNITYQPDVWIQHTVPSEFKAIGRYNIGLTAGIEATICHPTWIEGLNKMDLNIVSSKFSKKIFQQASFNIEQNGRKVQLKLEKPIEVLIEGVDLNTYQQSVKYVSNLTKDLDSIKEQFCFLTTGHWMKGEMGEDRKNIGYTIKTFLETFKNKQKQPALVLKIHGGTTSTMDRMDIERKIEAIKSTVKGKLPSLYLIHGEVSQNQMNELYNHPKIKALITLTKGEGFGRPLLEFASIGKPIIASGWSAHTEFLDSTKTLLLSGQLKPIDKSALQEKTLIKEANWFTPDPTEVGKFCKQMLKHYKEYLILAKKQKYIIREEWSLDNMQEQLKEILDQYLKTLPKEIDLDLEGFELPKLNS